MSQALIKLKQVWEFLCDYGTLSTFSQLIDKCVKMAFHYVMCTRADGTRGLGWELKEPGDAFCERVLRQMKQDLHLAYIAYNEANTRALEYPEYEKFMSALRICGFTISDQTLQNVTPMSKEQHDALRPAAPAPSGTPVPTPETRLAELLARLRDLLDEFTRKPRRTEAAPAAEARAGDAEDYASDDGI